MAELEDDALSASYLRGANLISRTTSATEYYTFNAHGDVVNLTNASGISVKTYDYDAFGNEKDRVGSDPNPFRYCGEYFDVESGCYYLRARYYDPSVGRFTQEDTAKDGLNWYSYTGGNPVLFIDPTGLTMIALRATIEEMGGVVEWDDSSKTATVYLDGKSVQVYAGDDNGSYIGSDGKMYTDDNGLFMALGTVVELGKGWIARIERDLSGAHGLRHIHLQKEDKYFAQIETGKPSHYNKWSDPGGPPNSVKKKLKKELDWDWDAKEKDWASKIKIEFYDLNVCRIEYPDGRTVIIRNSRWSFGIITMQDLRRYSDSTGPTYVDLCEGNEMAIPVVPMPNYVPIPVPIYYPAPVFAVP